jgi:Flp pilus assembly protein TadB
MYVYVKRFNFLLFFSYYPHQEAFDGNEHCFQLAVAKLILCANTYIYTPNIKKNEKKNSKIIVNKKKLKLNFELYFDFSSYFILSVRTELIVLEKKKEKNNLLLNSILHTPNNSNSGTYLYVYYVCIYMFICILRIMIIYTNV